MSLTHHLQALVRTVRELLGASVSILAHLLDALMAPLLVREAGSLFPWSLDRVDLNGLELTLGQAPLGRATIRAALHGSAHLSPRV